MSERTIRVKALCRVEGEGGLYIRLQNGAIADVQLNIYEPPRLFESLLRGRPLEDVPDITARICGICPVAYQMSSVHALERALDVRVEPGIRCLRRLLYCGEWIESHALHIYMLHAPDFLGYESGIDMARDHRDVVERGLRIKKVGNQLLERLGGRAIHPINVRVGGFYRVPRSEELMSLVPDLEWAVEAAVDTARWVAGFEFPEFEPSYQFAALVHDDEYPMNEGRVGVGRDLADRQLIEVTDYEAAFEEFQLPHTTALHSRYVRGSEPRYLVGPLARLNWNHQRLASRARRLADELIGDWPCRNPYRSIVARALEVVHACEEALAIVRDLPDVSRAHAEYTPRAAVGAAATEAPRGLLYHRYEVEADGRVQRAKIVPPTSQNQSQIEADLRELLPSLVDRNEQTVAIECERLVRSYDPCISCATHFLKVKIDRA